MFYLSGQRIYLPTSALVTGKITADKLNYRIGLGINFFLLGSSHFNTSKNQKSP